MGKFIIYLLIFLGWRFYKFYKKSLEEEKKKTVRSAGQSGKSKDPFKNLEELVKKWEEQSKSKEDYGDSPTSKGWTVEEVEPAYTEAPVDEPTFAEVAADRAKKYEKPKKERPIDTAEGWEFGESELRAAKQAHERHKEEFQRSEIVEEKSVADDIAENFDLRAAVVYSEILNRPYKD